MVIFQKEYLDLVLVPSGLLILLVYHLFLLYRYHNYPQTTVFGFENNHKIAWVDKLIKLNKRGQALKVLKTNITEATFLATASLALSTLISAWMANNSNIFGNGDTRPSTLSFKFMSLSICFIMAFSCFVQSTRSFIHANYLVTMPDSDTPTKYVETAVITGCDFWAFGIRWLYVAINLLFWFFGPIPMLATSVSMVVLLHYLDTNTK